MTYFKKNELSSEKSPTVNLISAIGNSLESNSETLYSKETFRAILNTLSPEDIENFKKPVFSTKTDKGFLYCNLIQFFFLDNFVYHFYNSNFSYDFFDKGISLVGKPEFMPFIKEYLPITKDHEDEVLKYEKIERLFSIITDISETLNIDPKKAFLEDVKYIIHPYNSDSIGYKVSSESYRNVNMFSAICLKTKSININSQFFEQNFDNCRDILLFASSQFSDFRYSLGNKQSKESFFQKIQDSILEEIVQITKEIPSSKMETFNKSLFSSSFFNSIMSDNIYPTPQEKKDFKATFDTLNPNFYEQCFNKAFSEKGFKLFNIVSDIHYDIGKLLDSAGKFLQQKKKNMEPNDVINFVFFNSPIDAKNAKELYSNKAEKGNNSQTISYQKLNEIAAWVESKGLVFDNELQFFKSFWNKKNFEGLMIYLDTISNNKEQILKVDKIISDFIEKHNIRGFALQYKEMPSKEFALLYEAKITEILLKFEIPENQNEHKAKPIKF